MNNKHKNSLYRKAHTTARSFLRIMNGNSPRNTHQSSRGWPRIAFIHNERRVDTGAHQANELMSVKMHERGAKVKIFYPHWQLADAPTHLHGIANILFFHSLLEHKDAILKYDIIQGTTYTTLPFLTMGVPIVAHFGSTVQGFLSNTPNTKDLPDEQKKFWRGLANLGVIPSFEAKNFRSLRDIADIEKLVASRVTMCVATSKKVEQELLKSAVPPQRIRVIHNAIEDYWFDTVRPAKVEPPRIVFLGRLGNDIFTLKMKGFDRLAEIYRQFPNIPKTIVYITANLKLKNWIKSTFSFQDMFVNLRKDLIPKVLAPLYGGLLFLPSRYEGFSLSLIEGMSQGLVPVAYSVGVVPEIIRNGENGFIVSSQAEARARIEELLADDAKRLAMAESARKTSHDFRSGHIVDQLLDVYKEIIASRKH